MHGHASSLRLCCPVVLSVWEIIGQADGGLSVLRTFRLLRVLKLVRFLPALRRQLVVLMKTMDNVATFCMLLMLFIFTFRYGLTSKTRLFQPVCLWSVFLRIKCIIVVAIRSIHPNEYVCDLFFSAVYWACICLGVNSVFGQRTETPSLTERTSTVCSGPLSLCSRSVSDCETPLRFAYLETDFCLPIFVSYCSNCAVSDTMMTKCKLACIYIYIL